MLAKIFVPILVTARLARPGNQTRLVDRDRPAVLGLVEMNLRRKHWIMPFGRTPLDLSSPVERHGHALSTASPPG